MLPVAAARARILAACRPVGSEWIELGAGLGRVLAADLAARRSQPPAAVSAMDGYAVRAADTDPPGRWLAVVGEVRAGGAAPLALAPGEAARIFTGGILPPGADAIAIQENAERDGARVRFSRAAGPGEFVRPAGLDFAAGWRGLAAGTVLDPRALALAAAMGHASLPVRRRPRVGVLATGDELVRPGEPGPPDAIVSSNSVLLTGCVASWGGAARDLGIARDTAASLRGALADIADLDLVVTSGGASVGEYDLVQRVLGEDGLELDFWKIAMRPGKPLIFGRLGRVPLLGLPGNPVSSAVCAVLFLRGALARMLGLDPAVSLRPARTAIALAANDEREDYLRCALTGGADGLPLVHPHGRQDSSMFAVLAAADALLVRAPHAPPVAAGARVEILPLAELLAPWPAGATARPEPA